MDTRLIDPAHLVVPATSEEEGPDCQTRPKPSHGNEAFQGLWRSEGDSIYQGTGHSFICMMPCSSEFQGWIGKVAVKEIHREGDTWVGLQAFRNKSTGALCTWVSIELTVRENRVDKYFPTTVPFNECVYGYTETYFRIEEP